jgi:hypothetical protein
MGLVGRTIIFFVMVGAVVTAVERILVEVSDAERAFVATGDTAALGVLAAARDGRSTHRAPWVKARPSPWTYRPEEPVPAG